MSYVKNNEKYIVDLLIFNVSKITKLNKILNSHKVLTYISKLWD